MTEVKVLSNSKFKKKLEKVTHQIPKQSLNKKSQKIQYQHNNESLNDDCLAEIFIHIPIKERPKVAQVCKSWNRALHSSWYQVKIVKLPHWEYHNYINTSQWFTGINKPSFSFLTLLLDNCGRFLTELDLSAYDNSDIMRFVNESCRNLVKLRLRFSFYKTKDLEDAFIGMSNLKILKIIFHHTFGIPMNIINSLKDLTNTLSELTLSYWGENIISHYRFPRTFPAIIPQLKALRKLELTGMAMNTNLHTALKDTNFFQPIDIYYKNMYSIKPETYAFIENIHLMNYEITDDVLYNFANNILLIRSIKVLSTNVTDDGIRTITQMKHLRCLYLYGANQHITNFSIQLLKNLLILHLPCSNKITDDSVTKVLNNSPLMNWLTIAHTGVTPRFPKRASIIASKRENYLILCVSFDSNIFLSQRYKLPYLAIHHHDEKTKLNKKLNGCSLERTDLEYYKWLKL